MTRVRSPQPLRVAVAHHLGWAILVTASDHYEVVDRRRVELVDPELPVAPVHHHGGAHPLHGSGQPMTDDALDDLVRRVRQSAMTLADAALDSLAHHVAGRIESLSLRRWPDDFPTDMATVRRPPHESRVDSIMYRQVLAISARRRGWAVHFFDAASVEDDVASILGPRSAEVLAAPRAVLGPPWNKDHRTALAATILAGSAELSDP